MAVNYSVNYDDERFKDVEADKEVALSENEKLYGGMISESDKFYQAQIDASEEYAKKQSELQQERTDFAIEQIEQKKTQANKDYIKEQSGAYVDWQKQSGEYGVNAEQMASQGLGQSGYSESSQVSMYNTYQNRVSTAREVYSKAVLEYDNAIKDAILQNNSVLAEIAYNALQKKLELSLEGFQYKNSLLIQQADKKTEIDNTYYARYQDVLNQINTENAMAEEIRQFELNYEMQVKELEEKIRQFNAEMERLKAKDKQEYQLEIKKLEESKKQAEAELAEKKRQHNETLAEEKRQFNKQHSGGSTIKISGGSGGSGGSKKATSTGVSMGAGIASSKYAVNTAYYQGSKNSDCKKYGTFSNGYQPKGISGHGKVSKTGETIQIKTQTLSGQKQTVIQNVWKTPDGKKWYWEGRQNKYIQIK